MLRSAWRSARTRAPSTGELMSGMNRNLDRLRQFETQRWAVGVSWVRSEETIWRVSWCLLSPSLTKLVNRQYHSRGAKRDTLVRDDGLTHVRILAERLRPSAVWIYPRQQQRVKE